MCMYIVCVFYLLLFYLVHMLRIKVLVYIVCIVLRRAVVSIILFSPSNLGGLWAYHSSPNFATCSVVTVIYKIK